MEGRREEEGGRERTEGQGEGLKERKGRKEEGERREGGRRKRRMKEDTETLYIQDQRIKIMGERCHHGDSSHQLRVPLGL